MAKTYRLNLWDSGDPNYGSVTGYVEYSISPDYSQGIAPGETVTISGTALWNVALIRSVVYRIFYEGGAPVNYFDAGANVYIARGAAGRFELSFRVPEEVFESYQGRVGHPLFVAMQKTGFIVSDDVLGTWGNPNWSDGDTRLTLLKYRLSPRILAMDFERATPGGAWADDGQYLQCKALRLAADPQAVVDDFTKATIVCAGSDGSTRSVNLTKEQIAAALTSDGYSETKPGIFAGFASALGVDYTLTLTLGDDYDQASFSDGVMRSFARLHLSGAKMGGVAVGTFSSATDDKPKFEVADSHEAFFYGGIHGVTNYSEGEVPTGGHWIDGKPIYVFVGKTGAVTKQGSYALKLPSAIDTLIDIQGYWMYPDGIDRRIPVMFASTNAAWSTTVMYDNSNAAVGPAITIATDQWYFNYAYIIVYYTKAGASSAPGLEVPSFEEMMRSVPDKNIARTDYVAMMAGIEIPDDAADDAQADAPGVESPGIEGDAPHSENYDKVANYYQYGVWSARMVRNAAGRWITEAEADELLDDEQTEGK